MQIRCDRTRCVSKLAFREKHGAGSYQGDIFLIAKDFSELACKTFYYNVIPIENARVPSISISIFVKLEPTERVELSENLNYTLKLTLRHI
jgi:hypothetical protein